MSNALTAEVSAGARSKEKLILSASPQQIQEPPVDDKQYGLNFELILSIYFLAYYQLQQQLISMTIVTHNDH